MLTIQISDESVNFATFAAAAMAVASGAMFAILLGC